MVPSLGVNWQRRGRQLTDITIQIKNCVRTGWDFASWKGEPLSVRHLGIAIEVSEAFEVDYKAFGPTESLSSYTSMLPFRGRGESEVLAN